MRARLAADQAEHELVVVLEQARRVDQVAAADRVEHGRDRDLTSATSFAGSGLHFELRLLAALHDDRRDAGHAVQARLEVVGRQLPQPRLRHRVRGQAVAHDRERGEGQPVRR